MKAPLQGNGNVALAPHQRSRWCLQDGLSGYPVHYFEPEV